MSLFKRVYGLFLENKPELEVTSSLMFVIIFGFDSTSVQRRNVKVQVEEFFSTILFYISFGIKSVRS